MPELPEVYTITKDLKKYATGHVIKDIRVEPRYHIKSGNNKFIKLVLGKKILDVNRIAKNIILELESNIYIRIHLGMSGRILLRNRNEIKDRWTRCILLLKNTKNSYIELRFIDTRKFGRIEVLNKNNIEKLRNKYGIEPTGRNINYNEIYKKIHKKDTSIKTVLLDQKIIAGLGNIYATDALFLSGIHPNTSAKKLSVSEIEKIILCAGNVLKEAIKNKGSTLKDKAYVNIFGKEGKYQKHFKIYEQKICPKCSKDTKVLRISGRRSWYCPHCQILK